MKAEVAPISIIICTYGRAQLLKNVIEDILNQEVKPLELIIVDQTPDDSVKKIVYNYIKLKYLKVRYICAQKYPSSLTISRNIGIENVNKNTKIVVFLDDDVRIGKKYVKDIINFFEKHNDAFGVTKTNPTSEYTITKIANIIFHFSKNKGRVLPCAKAENVPKTHRPYKVQWLSGFNMAYRREVFEKLRFDERLKRWSYMEDVDFSYRIFKRFGKLYHLPSLDIIHLATGTSRIPKKYEVLMRLSYKLYFFNKHFNKNIIQKIWFLWGFIGDCFQITFHGTNKNKKIILFNFKNLLWSIFYVLSNLGKIVDGKDPYLFNVPSEHDENQK